LDKLHLELKAATSEQHERLDALMANGLANRSIYTRYLHGMHRLAEALAPAPSDAASHESWALWFDPQRLKLLSNDLRKLGAPIERYGTSLPSSTWWMGANYVLEGSALGARLLLREATRLRDSDPGIALEFLQLHAQRNDRWPRFLAALATVDGLPRCDAHAGARHAFALVEQAMTCEETA
jgi:heme oxygenase